MHLTELAAVNLIRGTVGKAPVSTLQTENPDVRAAQNRLKNTTLELQANSWWFNTELSVTLTPDTSGDIIYPSNALEVRPQDPFAYLTIRGGKLYNPNTQSFTFTEAVVVDMLMVLDFNDLPYVAANYTMYSAARKFLSDFDGDPQRISELTRDEQGAYIALKTAEQRNRRVNVLHQAGPLRLMGRLQPRYTGNRILFT